MSHLLNRFDGVNIVLPNDTWDGMVATSKYKGQSGLGGSNKSHLLLQALAINYSL